MAEISHTTPEDEPTPERDEEAIELRGEIPPHCVDREGHALLRGSVVEIHLPSHFGLNGRVEGWHEASERLIVTLEDEKRISLAPQTFTRVTY